MKESTESAVPLAWSRVSPTRHWTNGSASKEYSIFRSQISQIMRINRIEKAMLINI